MDDEGLRIGVEESHPDGLDPYIIAASTACSEPLAVVTDDESEPLDCLLVELDGEDAVSRLGTRLQAYDRQIPIVAIDREPTVDRATEVSRLANGTYCPASSSDPRDVAEAVLNAASAARTRREDRQRRRFFEALMEGIPHSIYIKDRQARHLAASQHLEDTVMVDPIGKTDKEIWAHEGGDAGEASYADDLEVIESGTPIQERLEWLEPVEGDDLWMLTSKLPWREDGEIKGLVGISVDITDIKQETEILRERAERFEQFASFVSHDLRNPINVAQGFLEHGMETNDAEALERVSRALEHMETVIDDLLSMVRDDDEVAERISLREIAGDAWSESQTGDLEFHTRLPENLSIEAVPGQLHQLLDNLFRNANNHAGPDVTVTVGALTGGFYVEDDGRGIPPDMRESIFDYGESQSGTGIGLAIVNEIAESHGWTISVTESSDGGARFEFRNCRLLDANYRSVEPGRSIELERGIDIHQSQPAGEHTIDNDEITVLGGGTDVFGEVDEHYFIYGTVEGPCRIEARLADFHAVHQYSKAGVMIRSDISDGGPLGFTGMTRDHGSEIIWRSTADGQIDSEQFPHEDGLPRWFRIDRLPNALVFATSRDGKEWTEFDRRPFSAADDVFIGLTVCSHDPAELAEATFSEVTASELVPAAPSITTSSE